jgi:hypothetical protein
MPQKRLAGSLTGVVSSLAIISEKIRGAINFIVDAQEGRELYYADFAADINCSRALAWEFVTILQPCP